MADAVGKIGKLGRGFLDAGLQGFDLGLELRQCFAIARGGRRGFELGDARFQRGDIRLRPARSSAAEAAPGEGEADNANEAAKHARGKVGDEALQLGQARLRGRQRRIDAIRRLARNIGAIRAGGRLRLARGIAAGGLFG